MSDFTHGYLQRKWRPFEGDQRLSVRNWENCLASQPRGGIEKEARARAESADA